MSDFNLFKSNSSLCVWCMYMYVFVSVRYMLIVYTWVWKPEVVLSPSVPYCCYVYYFYRVGTHVLWCMCGSQRAVCRNYFSPSAMWVLGIESGLLTIVFTHSAVSWYSQSCFLRRGLWLNLELINLARLCDQRVAQILLPLPHQC